ncbi:hypothetical protein SCHPADRAFT_928758 [Schizopora paradoxa]|uniref:Uncharacterized protein n=1 Tax=Schizopora paradoxa TaxID=27342 RepID=A0A0H2RMK1_9AGAM|nr:hypothetical protein SCHPADRAFT_928758 [Schizopora paradoxa]
MSFPRPCSKLFAVRDPLGDEKYSDAHDLDIHVWHRKKRFACMDGWMSVGGASISDVRDGAVWKKEGREEAMCREGLREPVRSSVRLSEKTEKAPGGAHWQSFNECDARDAWAHERIGTWRLGDLISRRSSSLITSLEGKGREATQEHEHEHERGGSGRVASARVVLQVGEGEKKGGEKKGGKRVREGPRGKFGGLENGRGFG